MTTEPNSPSIPETQAKAAAPARMGALRLWVGLMLGLIALPALVQAGLELSREETPGVLEVFSTRPTEEHLRAFEQDLEDSSWLVQGARRHWGSWLDTRLGRGSRRVVLGRRDWLFYRPGVEMVAAPGFDTERAHRLLPEAFETPQASRTLQAAQASILDWHRQLADLGIALVLVPVPVKATVHPEFLEGDIDPLAWPDNPAVAPWLDALRQAGVTVVEVDALLQDLKRDGETVFLPRDTHWTPHAMGQVAKATARVVRQLPGVDEALGPAAEFDHRRIRYAGWGDLVGMLDDGRQGATRIDGEAPSGAVETTLGPEGLTPMTVEVLQVIATAEGEPPLRDQGSPVLLLGDSLTAIYSNPALGFGRGGGFGERLADALGTPIERIAMPAGGARRARETLALEPARLHGKRVVVWQLTRRDLLWGDWTPVDLPSAASVAEAAQDLETPGSDRPRRVVAWVVESSRLPRRLDYAECRTVVRYRRIDGDLIPGAGRDFFVAHLGWSDFTPTEAADYPIGQVHALELLPQGAGPSLEDSCWVDTVGLDRTPWFPRSVEVRQ